MGEGFENERDTSYRLLQWEVEDKGVELHSPLCPGCIRENTSTTLGATRIKLRANLEEKFKVKRVEHG